MTTNLYEELGVLADATQEQIRKAYKKRALQTHPDRLHPGATPAEKADSDEKFRRVNNAYEILSDPKKRSEYDTHGVWPPPEELFTSRMPGGSHQRAYSRTRSPSRSHTFPDPFFSHHRHSPFRGFQFTDPFTLFNSIFEGTPFSSHPRSGSYPRVDPFEHMQRMQTDIERFMDDIDRDPFSQQVGGFPRFGPMLQMPAFPAIDSSQYNNNRGRWVSESFMTSTVNGVTQTIRKRIDSEGNEHITRTLPDGREVRTINGVEQTSGGYLPYADAPKNRRITADSSSGHRYLPPAPPHPQPVVNTSRLDYGVRPPPYSASSTYREPSPPLESHRRPRRSSDKDKYAYAPNPTPEPRFYEERHRKSFPDQDLRSQEERRRKKKWWQ